MCDEVKTFMVVGSSTDLDDVIGGRGVHRQQIQALRIPLPAVIRLDLAALDRADQKVDVAQLFEPMTDVALEQLKARSGLQIFLQQILHADVQGRGEAIHRLGAALLQPRLSAADIVERHIRNAAVLGKPILGHILRLHDFRNRHQGSPAFLTKV